MFGIMCRDWDCGNHIQLFIGINKMTDQLENGLSLFAGIQKKNVLISPFQERRRLRKLDPVNWQQLSFRIE